MKNCIVIYDSGIGGLSVLKTLYKIMPCFNYVYFADNKNLPYGNKSKEDLLSIVSNNTSMLIKKYDPMFIVYGCNTIGTTIFGLLKARFKTTKLFALKPIIQPKICNCNKTLLIATSQTINSISKTKNYLKNKHNIILCKMPLLATNIENNILNPVNIVPYLTNNLKYYANINYVILGCSHYYFVKTELQSIFKNANIIDGTMVLTEEILKHILKINYVVTCKTPGKIKLILTSYKNNKLRTYKKIIKNIKK